jgi:integrase/recombinase XerD
VVPLRWMVTLKNDDQLSLALQPPTVPHSYQNRDDLISPFVRARRSPATRRSYQSDLRDFVAVLDLRNAPDLLAVRPEDVVRYRTHLEERQASAATIARKLTTIRSFYEYSKQRGWVERNPAHARLVEPPSVPNESTTPGLSRSEVRAILDAVLRDSLIGKRDYAILMLLSFHGLRRAELTALTPSSFSEERGHSVLTVFGKGSKSRKHTVKPQILTAIRNYLDAAERVFAGDAPLFTPVINNRTGTLEKPLGNDAVRNVVIRAALRAGIKRKITTHSMRRAAITAALDGGASLRRVSYFSGHSDPKTTCRYDTDRQNLDDNAAQYVNF